MRSLSKQSKLFRKINCQNIDVKYKSHLYVNRSSYGIAVDMHLLIKQASAFCLFTGPITVNRLNKPGCEQFCLKCQHMPFLFAIYQVI